MSEESDAAQPTGGDSGRAALVGAWEKLTKGRCAEIYPQRLQFSERGIYFGKSEETPASLYHTVWDAGRYEVVDAHHIMLSTSNDAEVTYRFSVAPDLLTFTDKDGCEFEYRRVVSEA